MNKAQLLQGLLNMPVHPHSTEGGWKERAPGGKRRPYSERTDLAAQCPYCFLRPADNTYPVCPRLDWSKQHGYVPCGLDCRGLWAAAHWASFWNQKEMMDLIREVSEKKCNQSIPARIVHHKKFAFLNP